jgi:AcrR family transcriptional regulator
LSTAGAARGPAPRRTQAERSRATKAALLEAGRQLFAERGFAATGSDQIAERAGVTRGALYHHFTSKEQLFQAVVEDLEVEIGARIMAAAAKGRDPATELRLGCQAFLDTCLDPAIRRIVLLEAPAVLGWDTWRAIDARYGLAMVSHALEAVMAAGQMTPAPVGPLAHMLLGALNEAAHLLATASRPRVARAEVGGTVGLLLDRLIVAE